MLRVGSSFGVAALPDLPSHLAHAFGDSFGWAFALTGVALVPILLLPRRRPVVPSVVEGDGPVAEPVDDRA